MMQAPEGGRRTNFREPGIAHLEHPGSFCFGSRTRSLAMAVTWCVVR